MIARTGDARQVITDENAPYYGVKVSQRSLTPDNADRLSPTHLGDWLGHTAHAGGATA